MKKIILMILFASVSNSLLSQKVGIGATTPMNKLEVVGSLPINTQAGAT